MNPEEFTSHPHTRSRRRAEQEIAKSITTTEIKIEIPIHKCIHAASREETPAAISSSTATMNPEDSGSLVTVASAGKHSANNYPAEAQPEHLKPEIDNTKKQVNTEIARPSTPNITATATAEAAHINSTCQSREDTTSQKRAYQEVATCWTIYSWRGETRRRRRLHRN